MPATDTIAAIATPLGQSGIGIVRLSGPRAIRIATRLFRPAKGRGPQRKDTFRQYYGWVIEPEGGQAVDEVILSVMRAPRTYTREDVAEINCHGGIVSLRQTLDIVLRLGARLAEPGEFTKRAFLNGRIDLTQAESVLDVIQAKSGDALHMATSTMQGRLSEQIASLREALLELLAEVEAAINFPEEDITAQGTGKQAKALQAVRASMAELLAAADRSSVYREGITMVIAGRVNVGKSSILNALLQRERAIVSGLPGTTRDTVEETIVLRGVPVRLVDTAGFTAGAGPLEEAGQQRTEAALAEAHLILLVLDRSSPLQAEDERLIARLKNTGTPKIVVYNKTDLPSRLTPQSAEHALQPQASVAISATRGWNMAALEEKASRLLQQEAGTETSAYMVNLRQRQCLATADEALAAGEQNIHDRHAPELAAEDLRKAIGHLDAITGARLEDEALNRIFDRFCIGK